MIPVGATGLSLESRAKREDSSSCSKAKGQRRKCSSSGDGTWQSSATERKGSSSCISVNFSSLCVFDFRVNFQL
uniref:Uncharacterized protein MANES_01G087600 n=1 Tax=Rhizophora mucronata TaxID=61149 RepID=A0A2P2NNA9_RHIMU